MLGCANIKPKYKFTSENSLVEVAKLLVSMGGNTYKFSLTPSSVDLVQPLSVKTLKDIVETIPEYKQVFDMPGIKHYVFWAYTIGGAIVKDRFNESDAALEYSQVYDLTRYLLRTYSGSGKTFYLGNWESDWGAMGVKSFEDVDPPKQVIDNLTRYFTVRQKAVDDAKRDCRGGYSDVDVYHYAEVVMVKEAINNPPGSNARCVNAVIPFVTNLDYVSWSAYTIQDDSREDVHRYLSFVESCMPLFTKEEFLRPRGKRVFIGEFGWMHLDGMPCAQHQATFLQNVFSWGCPMALFWQMYGGGANTYCLVRPDGSRNESFSLYCEYLKDPSSFSFDAWLEKSQDGYMFKRNTIHRLQETQTFDQLAELQDDTTLDLYGQLHTFRGGIRNVGGNVRIVNTNITNTATLVISSSCTFGKFANDWFSGYKRGGGNAMIQGDIDVIIRGAGTVVTFDSRNAFTGRIIIEPGSTLVAQVKGCLETCSECIMNGTLTMNTIDVFGEKTVIRIGKGAYQIVWNVSDTLSNDIYFDMGSIGVKGRGLVDVVGKSEVTLCGNIYINSVPENGGHFGGNINVKGMLMVQGTAKDTPLFIRRGGVFVLPEASRMKNVQTVCVLQGTLQMQSDQSIANLSVCLNGDVVIDLGGYNLTIDTMIRGKNNLMLTNTGKQSATCTITNLKTQVSISPNETRSLFSM